MGSSGWETNNRIDDTQCRTAFDRGKYVTFHPSNETDYVKQCNGTISEEEQADLFANGTYAYPHIFQELKWSDLLVLN